MAKAKQTKAMEAQGGSDRAKKKTTPAAAAAPGTKRPYVRKAVSVHVQYAGMEWDTAPMADQAVTAWAEAYGQKKTAAKQIQLYVKPEEQRVYYVINGDSGFFSLV